MITDPALVVVDMQKDFSKPGFALGESHMQAALDNTGAFLERYRDTGRTPILVRTVFDEHLDAKNWQRKHTEQGRGHGPCRRGTEGTEFAPELAVQDDDVIVTKHRFNAFHNTPLGTLLSANNVSELFICGIATNVCVESTARAAWDRNYQVTVLQDCCTTRHLDYEQRVLENMQEFFADVRKSEDIELPPI